MNTKMIPLKVSAWLESYQTAFEQLDAEAIAELFVYPLQITGDDEQIRPVILGSREAWTNQLRGLLRGYRGMGFSSAQVLDLSVIEVSTRLFVAAIHWDLRDRSESSLYDFTAVYTLAETGGGLRVTAIAHNEPRIAR